MSEADIGFFLIEESQVTFKDNNGNIRTMHEIC